MHAKRSREVDETQPTHELNESKKRKTEENSHLNDNLHDQLLTRLGFGTDETAIVTDKFVIDHWNEFQELYDLIHAKIIHSRPMEEKLFLNGGQFCLKCCGHVSDVRYRRCQNQACSWKGIGSKSACRLCKRILSASALERHSPICSKLSRVWNKYCGSIPFYFAWIMYLNEAYGNMEKFKALVKSRYYPIVKPIEFLEVESTERCGHSKIYACLNFSYQLSSVGRLLFHPMMKSLNIVATNEDNQELISCEILNIKYQGDTVRVVLSLPYREEMRCTLKLTLDGSILFSSSSSRPIRIETGSETSNIPDSFISPDSLSTLVQCSPADELTPDLRDYLGGNALIHACSRNNLTIVHYLLENGHNPFVTDFLGNNAFYWSQYYGSYDCFLCLQNFTKGSSDLSALFESQSNTIHPPNSALIDVSSMSVPPPFPKSFPRDTNRSEYYLLFEWIKAHRAQLFEGKGFFCTLCLQPTNNATKCSTKDCPGTIRKFCLTCKCAWYPQKQHFNKHVCKKQVDE